MVLKAIIAPSVLASDMSCLKDESKRMIGEGCDWLHLDIMDGNFVPNISFGPPVIECLRRHVPEAFLDIHLMVSNPEMWLEPLLKSRVNNITFHYEAFNGDEGSVLKLAAKIKEAGVQAGLAIKPSTDILGVESVLRSGNFDLLLVMTVEPGFGGSQFMSNMMGKVLKARHAFPELNIQVDGGLNTQTVKEAAESGANIIVAGTSIYTSEDPRAMMEYMRDVIVANLQ